MISLSKNIITIQNLSIFEYCILAIFFIHLPFVYALTIDIGFPLKISEIALAVIILVFLIKRRFQSLLVISRIKPFLILTSVFLIVLTISTIINSFWQYNYPLNFQLFRSNHIISSYLKLGYTYFAIIASWVVYIALTFNKRFFLGFFFAGAILACLYCWYLFWFSLLEIHYYTLPGSDQFPQAALFKFGHFIRSGTFKEGNHMGLFLLVSGIVAFYQRKTVLAIFFLLTIITTASSIAVITSFIFILGVFVQKQILARKYRMLLVTPVLITCIGLGLYYTSPDFRYMFTKLIPNRETQNRDALFSQQERINLVSAALDMAIENPAWGVGLTRFSAHYEYYNHSHFYQKDEKMLPNNIYLEILSEAGLIALILFVFLIYLVGNNAFSFTLKWGLGTVLIYWLAYPTFTVLFLWFFVGVLLSDDENN